MFNNIIYLTIFTNTLIRSLNNYLIYKYFDTVQYYVYYISILFFNLEIFIKIFAKIKFFFFDHWNKFDFLILIISDIFIIIDMLTNLSQDLTTLPSIIRFLRIMTIFNLIKKNNKLKSYLEAIIMLTPGLVNIIALILLLLII